MHSGDMHRTWSPAQSNNRPFFTGGTPALRDPGPRPGRGYGVVKAVGGLAAGRPALMVLATVRNSASAVKGLARKAL